MSVTGKNCMGINALCLADRVDLAKHFRAAAVITASSAGSGRRRITKWRMVHSQKDCARILFVFNACKLREKVIKLSVGNICPVAVFAGNNSRVLERVAKQANDSNERCIQREVNARLRHRSSMK